MDQFLSLVADRPDFWLSLVVIGFMLGMAGFFVWFFVRHVRQEDREKRMRQ